MSKAAGASVDGSAGEYAARSVRRLARAVARAGKDFARSGDEEDLHQVRVASRRLRAALSLFAPVLDPGVASVRAGLRRRAAPFGELRDLDVFLLHLDGHAYPVSPSDAASLRKQQRRRRRKLARTVSAVLGSRGWTRDLATIRHATRHVPRDPAARTPARDFVAGRLDEWWDAFVTTSADLARLESHPRHRVRIRAKRLRYACDLTADLFPARAADRMVAQLTQLQDELGDLNDAITAGHLLIAAGLRSDLPKPDLRALTRAVVIRDSLAHTAPYWR